jgi:hypothetical protein
MRTSHNGWIPRTRAAWRASDPDIDRILDFVMEHISR